MERRQGIILGVGLIILGIAFLIAHLLGNWGDVLTSLVIGVGFLLWYADRRRYGLLIPGALFIGVGLGAIAERLTPHGAFDTIGLGLGFLLIYGIDWLTTHANRWWPLLPGLFLLLSGLGDTYPLMNRLGWPIAIIIAGILLLLNALGLFARRRE